MQSPFRHDCCSQSLLAPGAEFIFVKSCNSLKVVNVDQAEGRHSGRRSCLMFRIARGPTSVIQSRVCLLCKRCQSHVPVTT